ncbi:MAG TPA: hypothetical protein VF461_09235 [Gemmatimonadaceae bacterium]
MTAHYTLTSHGTVLGHTGAAFPAGELPPGAHLWHLIPTRAFALIEPIIAELTAPPALTLVEDVIPTRDDYLHPGWSEQQAQMDRLMDEAARVHHFRLVLERYEALRLELHDGAGRRVAVAPMIMKQMVPAESVRAFAEAVDPDEAQWIDADEPCYLVMAHLDDAATAAAAATAA